MRKPKKKATKYLRVHDREAAILIHELANMLEESLEILADFDEEIDESDGPGVRALIEEARASAKNPKRKRKKPIRLDSPPARPPIEASLPPPPSYAPPRQYRRCNVPMCGESGVCEDCRAQGAR